MARINVEQKALTDPRFDLLGRFLESTRHDALGRMLLVWNECLERCSYILPERLVGAIIGNRDGAKWLVESDLAEWSRKPKKSAEGILRIKGTEGRIEWLATKRERARENGQKGGRPKANLSVTNVGSTPVSSGYPPETPPAPAPAPAPALKTEELRAPPSGEAKLPQIAFPIELDSPEFRETWNRWLADRRKRKLKKPTPDGERTQFAKLAAIGVAKATECIETSIANGWQGLFPDRFTGKPANGFKTHDDRVGEIMFPDSEAP